MIRAAAILTFLAACLPGTGAFAADRTFAPAGEWSVLEGAEACMLVREFRDSREEDIRLQLRMFGGGETVWVTMVGDGLPLRSSGTRGVARFDVRFLPYGEWTEAWGTTGFVDEVDALTFDMTISGFEEIGLLGQVALSLPRRDDVVLDLGDMAGSSADLGGCLDAKRAEWGPGTAAIAEIATPAERANPSEIGEAIGRGMMDGGLSHSDTIHFRMVVEKDGSPADCVIQSPRRGSAVEKLICDTMVSLARFEPARNAAGEPVSSLLFSKIVFSVR